MVEPQACCLLVVLEMWNITSLVGKESELLFDVEHYQLDIAGLTYTHSTGSGTQWAGLSFSGMLKGLRCWLSVGILSLLKVSPGN